MKMSSVSGIPSANRFMQKAMTDAYFLGLRDAKAAYQELNDFDRFTAAMEKAAEDLTRKEAQQ